jgi:hypothetical protein
MSKLTDKQVKNIHSLDAYMVVEIMHECAERLGIVTVDEYCKIMCEKRRTVYDKLKNNKIMKIEIAGRIFVIVNET